MSNLIKRLAARVSRFRIRSKIIVIYLLVGVLPFLVFTVYFFHNTNRQMIESETALLQTSLDQAIQSVSGTLDMYNTISNYLFNEPGILTALNKSYGTKYYSMYEAYKTAIAPVYTTYYSLYPNLNRITIYSSCDILPYSDYVRDIAKLESQPWFERVNGTFTPTWVQVTEDGATKLLSVRRIGVPSEYPYLNYLCLEVDYDSVFEPLMSLAPDGYGVLVTDATGKRVFSHSAIVGVEPAQIGSMIDQADYGTYRVIDTPLQNSGWTVYFISDPNSIFGAVTRLTSATYRNVWLLLLGLGAVAIWFISTLVKPIEQLTKNIRQIDNGRMDITVTTTRKDEIGVLVHSFSEMIARIRELIDVTYKDELEKREYQQRLLSAQINPHFLYNSLSLINSKAIMAGQSEISQTTILLSQFYRSALNHGLDITTVESELNNIRSYVNLQQLLSDRCFEARFVADDRLSDVRIPNFILQPIVENAIDHGLKNSPEQSRLLTIHVQSEGDALVIAVHDNGIGMDEEEIALLFTRESEGYGIKNVRDRLHLMYQGQCEMQIQSIPGEGTRVTLRMPKAFFG